MRRAQARLRLHEGERGKTSTPGWIARRPSRMRCVGASERPKVNGDGYRAIDPLVYLSYFTRMSKLPIITLPDPMLRRVSAPVERVDLELLRLAADMLETMYAAPGIGLAAVQVGVPRRLVVLDVSEDEDEKRPLILINPEIVALGSEPRLHEEGCLSIPDFRLEIERPSAVTISYLDHEGERRELAAEGLLATAIQHEIDHLNGKLIVDFLSRLKRELVVKKLKKLPRGEVPL